MEDINDNTRNLYIIKRRLAELNKSIDQHGFRYYISDFVVRIYTNSTVLNDSIVKHESVDVYLYEEQRTIDGRKSEVQIDINSDSRFVNYAPLHPATSPVFPRHVTIVQLCELVKYLHRLANLSVFA